MSESNSERLHCASIAIFTLALVAYISLRRVFRHTAVARIDAPQVVGSIFKALDDPARTLSPTEQDDLKKLAQEVGIPAFRLRVAKLSARLGKENLSGPELNAEIDSLHQEASALLEKLVDSKGTEFVEHFLH